MGKDAAAIRAQFQTRLGQVARELGRELYPDGLPRGTKFSELEAVAGALADELARQLIEAQVRVQARGVSGLRGAGPQGPRRAPRVEDHAGRCGLEAARRQLPPLSAGFFPLRTGRWAWIARA